ncbi:hypothetical protein M378DRAFT_67282 [Amanita muscaria Koide BX008]|uniref:VWFA domain-containing protein n=1 Tax=Amanita muscaria (strain Koide BX008) TaxID=946122 RepID=A0A0C2T3A9_AMAMK|nr:hypothetical protein M378DRAFT_67282 [Amanita muscaria Koide BX008]
MIDTRPPARRTTEEDVLEALTKFDTVFIVDDSSSMRGARWEEAKAALATLAELAGRYDTNGIDVHFLNHEAVGRNLKDSSDIIRLFQNVRPNGATPIGNKLEELLIEYLSVIEPLHDRPAELKKVRPVNFLVITDGYPTDDPESVIVQIARRLDAKYFPITQVGIQFVQIGNDRSATQYLQELDDGLSNKHKIRDIVDTTPYNGSLDGRSILKILLGGINRRVDSRGAAAFSQ